MKVMNRTVQPFMRSRQLNFFISQEYTPRFFIIISIELEKRFQGVFLKQKFKESFRKKKFKLYIEVIQGKRLILNEFNKI